MMEEKKNIFNYISQLFATFGIIVTIFIVLSIFIGEGTGEYSSLFRLGREALTIPTLLQLLFIACAITCAQVIFYTDILIKNMALILRNVLFFMVVMGVLVVMAILFNWFPTDDPTAWISFAASFAISIAVSVFVMWLKERTENKRMRDALDKYNKHH